jgi:hypothetical protein
MAAIWRRGWREAQCGCTVADARCGAAPTRQHLMTSSPMIYWAALSLSTSSLISSPPIRDDLSSGDDLAASSPSLVAVWLRDMDGSSVASVEPAPSTIVAPRHSSSPLNPLTSAFSPSSMPRSTASEELQDWLRFSPSSSKGGSSACGRASFVDVIQRTGKGKAPAEGSSSRSSRDPTTPSVGPPTRFMADARWANGGAASQPQQTPLKDGGGEWQLVTH